MHENVEKVRGDFHKFKKLADRFQIGQIRFGQNTTSPVVGDQFGGFLRLDLVAKINECVTSPVLALFEQSNFRTKHLHDFASPCESPIALFAFYPIKIYSQDSGAASACGDRCA